MRQSIVTITALIFLHGTAVAQRDAKVPVPDPEIEKKSFIVADGFEVNLFAADPMLAKPIQMNFDPQGRLWVASSEVYPQIKPGQTANDKVLILEDTNGDGTADKTTVYADGLLIPTGLAPGDGGVYVADSTDLVHFSDPDPETGKARKKQILLSGFGTEDTHHIIHTFRWGPDGRMFFNQSIYIHSHVETPHGVKRLNAGGIWRYRPETTELEVFARGWVNPWGTQFDRYGQTFVTDGAGGQGINYAVPGAAYLTAQWSGRILDGLNPGSPKYCGLEIVSGRHLPDDWQGNLITNDFRGHRVCRFVVKPEGSGFRSVEMPELLKSTHPAFRPVDVAIGPDGAIYIADWYNPIIQHGEVDFRDPRRDKTHGRIWRITAKNRDLVPRPKLVDASVAELLDSLKQPEDWTRRQAKRVLLERGADAVLPELDRWFAQEEKAGNSHALLEALWVRQSFDSPDSRMLFRVLADDNPRVRAAACRVAGDWVNRESVADLLPKLAKLATDPHPLVRLEAVRAVSRADSTEAALAVATALELPVDNFLDYAIWLSLRELAPQWLPDLEAGKVDFGGDARKLIFALQSADTGNVSGPLEKLVRSERLDDNQLPVVLKALGQFGNSEQIGLILSSLGDLPTNVQNDVLASLAASVQSRKLNAPSEAANRLAPFLEGGAKAPSARLVGLWKLNNYRSNLEQLAKDGDAAEQEAAMAGLASFGDDAALSVLRQLAVDADSLERAVRSVIAISSVNINAAAPLAVTLLGHNPSSAAELFAAFVQRQGGDKALLAALKGQKLPADAAKVGVRLAKSAGKPNQQLIDRLTEAGGLTQPKRDWTADEIDALAKAALADGNPHRGEAVYRRAELTCMKCHAIGGAGGAVGPDMSSLGASAQPDYIVESLLLPDAKIKEGFHTLVVDTIDGKVATGIKVSESPQELVLRDAENKQVRIPTADIESSKNGRSLMPDGLTDPLTRQEFLDLSRFLIELGKVNGEFVVKPAKLVRTWEVVQPSADLQRLTNRDRLGAVAKPDAPLNWAANYSKVNGELPLEELPRFRPHRNQPEYSAVRFPVTVGESGELKLKLPNPNGLFVWIDGAPLEPAKQIGMKLSPGKHTVTIGIDRNSRQEPLVIELPE